MPVARRGDAWEVTVNWKGQRHRRSSRLWSQAQAREVERKLLNDLHALSLGQKPVRTFDEAIAEWVKHEVPTLRSPEREKSHMRALAPFLKGRYLSDGPAIAMEIRSAWRELTPSSVNRRLSLLRRLLNLAWKEWGWVDLPLGQKVAMLPCRDQRQTYASPAQVEALARKMPRSGGYVLLAAYTGIRRGQLLRLTKANVVNGAIVLGTDGKTGKPQVIPLHPRVRAIAAKLPLCSSKVLWNEWDDARIALNLVGVRFHDLRHTAASWLIQTGATIKHVADFLGHADTRMANRYAHLGYADIKTAVMRMPQMRHSRKRKAA